MTTTPIPTAKRNPLVLLRDGILISVALVLLAIVLLPLVWMILTAFKVKGTAFQLEFLPKMTVVLPPDGRPAYPLPAVEAGKWFLHAETKLPDATTVQIAVTPDGDAEKIYDMVRFAEGNWAATVGPLPDKRVEYGFIVNGTKETVAAKDLDKRSYPAQKSGVTSTGDSAMVYQDGETITASVIGSIDSDYLLDLGKGRVEPLAREAAKYAPGLPVHYTATIPSKGEKEFRIVEKRGFGEAVAKKYTLQNFKAIVSSDDFNFARFFFNSLVVATSAGLLTVLICTLAGYAFATKRFHYREELFAGLLGSMLVPGMIFMVPQFSITLGLGLMNTYAGMVVPHLANVFGLFLLRQYIGQIPKDLFNAAEIDGAREYQIFQNVVIPVCLPIMVTLFLLVFVGQWSNFLWQLIVNTGQSTVLTLPVGLQQFKGQNANEWEKIMAGACFSILPIAALFLTLQKYFLEGLTAGSVKE